MLKRKELRSTPVLSMISDKAAEVRRNFLNFLNRKTRDWTRRQQKWFLFTVCLVVGGLSTLSLFGIDSDAYPESTKTFTIVAPVIRSPISPNDITGNIYYTDTLVFNRFREAVDSLQQTPEGRKTYEDFIRQHPGFLDSLTNAEELFKKKFHY